MGKEVGVKVEGVVEVLPIRGIGLWWLVSGVFCSTAMDTGEVRELLGRAIGGGRRLLRGGGDRAEPARM